MYISWVCPLPGVKGLELSRLRDQQLFLVVLLHIKDKPLVCDGRII